MTYGFCGQRLHYEEECHTRKKYSDKLKAEDAASKGGGKSESKTTKGRERQGAHAARKGLIGGVAYHHEDDLILVLNQAALSLSVNPSLMEEPNNNPMKMQ